MNNQTDIGLKFTNKIVGARDLANYEKRLKNIHTLMKQVSKGTKVNTSLKEAAQDSEKIDKNMSSAFSVAKFAGFNIGLKKIAQSMTSLIKKSSDYLENLNLYQVAFGEAYKEADKFVNKISEMYGLDESWTIKTTGLFRQLANSMGLASAEADKLSYLMTEMSLDISSLYNVDVDRASQVLQSALAGQTRPIRSVTGADITQNTLQQTLDQLNIDKAVNQLSFAEKRLVIIISLTQQLAKATNDMGKTIEQPANQLRMLEQQWQRLTRAVGSVFLPLLQRILPYLNAILMVLTEIISIVARLFGYNEEDYDFLTGVADSAIDLEEGLDGANESAKKLKQGLRGFDKLNVITTPTSTDTSVGGGIDPSILNAYNDAFANYQDSLMEIETRASKIRDSIMEWLGFTKEIDEETKDVNFKFDHITGGTVLGALVVGGTIYKGIKAIYNIFSRLTGLKFVGITSLFGKNGTFAKAFGKGGFITSFITSNPKLLIILGTVTLLVTAFVNLYKKSESFRKKVDELVKTFKEDFANAISKIKELLEPFLKTLMEVSKKLWDEVIKPLGKMLIEILEPIIETIVDILGKFYQNVFKPMMPILENLAKITLDIISRALKYIADVLSNITDILLWLWHHILEPVINYTIKAIEEKITPILEILQQSFEMLSKGIEKIKTAWDNLWFNKKEANIDVDADVSKAKFSLKSFFGDVLKNVGSSVFKFMFPSLSFMPFAEGGLPPVGQMFIANEKGPELVGQIGGKSFVANENQMLGLIKDELATAKGGTTNATIIVQVGSEELARTVINDLQDMAKTNGKPIIIGQ